ncbi:uncharacterized protein CLIB1444_13S02234 [[Candida] jaroonii]|uniref:Uncharacterized protein n=1 Tax=[Candida] jaroonii TaxID=467808 RepID=A0ACA9YDM9_9ASCO|nr:uncharacterized protein CLIB1444_13S02234 [[Candida] jaroonii]
MNLNHPDFLNNNDQFRLPPNSNNLDLQSSSNPQDSRDPNSKTSFGGAHTSTNANISNLNQSTNSNINELNNDNLNTLFNKLNLDLEKSPTSKPQLPITSPLVNPFSPNLNPYNYNINNLDSFNLPLELQGGIGNISSRRPSYAAESFTRDFFLPSQSHFGQGQPHQMQPMPPMHSQAQVQGQADSINTGQNLPQGQNQFAGSFQNQGYSEVNNQNLNQLNNKLNLFQYATTNNYLNNFNPQDNFNNFNLNANFNDFQSRRPSQLVDFSSFQPFDSSHNVNSNNNRSGSVSGNSGNMGNDLQLENGLIFRNNQITSSPDLKQIFGKTTKYFQDPKLTDEILSSLDKLLESPIIQKLITFIKNLNNLNFNHKILCLVINKNGKFDLLSYPNNSNLSLTINDLVIVDGDRGKDLVMICKPIVELNFAILFNFLKKLEHLKSLKIDDSVNSNLNNSTIAASNIISNTSQDNEFVISLPTKQVLRFATPKEANKISGKFLEEKKAFMTCFNKIQELNLQNNLKLINVEYQSDFKKLIFYYYANFKRIDFRSLIKELFKIYKTRIWLCAILPYDNPQSIHNFKNLKPLENLIPSEYKLGQDDILNFSIDNLNTLKYSNYFHSINLKNLINLLENDVKGFFYGFNPNK